MKPIFSAFLLLGTAGCLIAGEEKPTTGKFLFVHVGADQQRTEVEARALISEGRVSLPLVLPDKTLWICIISLDPASRVSEFSVHQAGSSPGPAPVEGSTTLPILQVSRVWKNGEEEVLVKSTAFTVTATVTVPKENLVPEAEQSPPAATTTALTDEELKRVEVKTTYDPGNERIRLTGYNPFEKSLGKGVLRVILPKTAEAAESVRDYAVTLNGAGLADFSGEIRAAFGIAQGTKPLFKLVKLQFTQ